MHSHSTMQYIHNLSGYSGTPWNEVPMTEVGPCEGWLPDLHLALSTSHVGPAIIEHKSKTHCILKGTGNKMVRHQKGRCP